MPLTACDLPLFMPSNSDLVSVPLSPYADYRLPSAVVTRITEGRDGRHRPSPPDFGSLLCVKRVGLLCRYYLSRQKVWRSFPPSRALNAIDYSSVWRVSALRASLPPPLDAVRTRRLGVKDQHTSACIRSPLLSPSASFPSDLTRFSLFARLSSDVAGVSLPQEDLANPREFAKLRSLTSWEPSIIEASVRTGGSIRQIQRRTLVANRGTKNGC
jgi:hypothetical protein